jgi:hypothetical protein
VTYSDFAALELGVEQGESIEVALVSQLQHPPLVASKAVAVVHDLKGDKSDAQFLEYLKQWLRKSW